MKRESGETYDASDFVCNEIARLVLIRRCHEEILVERVREDPQHQVASGLHARVPRALAPHLQRVCEHGVFAGALFVLAVGRFKEAFCPRVAVIPVEGAGEGEEGIGRRGVTGVAD